MCSVRLVRFLTRGNQAPRTRHRPGNLYAYVLPNVNTAKVLHVQAGHGTDLAVSQAAPSRQLLLDLLECLPSSLGHEEEGEQGPKGHDAREHVEHVGRPDQLHHPGEGLGDDEGAGPVQSRDDGGGGAPDLDGQGLPHEEPWNGAPS